MPKMPSKVSARARLALRLLAEYEVRYGLIRADAVTLAARDAGLSEWYLQYSLLKIPAGREMYQKEVDSLQASASGGENAA